MDVHTVLAAGDQNGRHLEMIRNADGMLTITFNGQPEGGYRWPPEQLEECVTTYLAILRHRPELLP